MMGLRFDCSAIYGCVALALLAGCGGSQQTLGTPRTGSQPTKRAPRSDRHSRDTT